MESIKDILKWTVNAAFACRKPGELIAVWSESHRKVYEATGDVRVALEDLRIMPILCRLNERVVSIASNPRSVQPRYDALLGRRPSMLDNAKSALDNAITLQLETWITMLSALQDSDVLLPEGYGRDLEKIVSSLENMAETLGE